MPQVGSCVPARDGHRGEVTWPAPASAENRTSPMTHRAPADRKFATTAPRLCALSDAARI